MFARATGALYLIVFVLGSFLQIVMGRVVVSGDAEATASHLTALESIWRWGIASECIALICVTALAMIYFVLLWPVSWELNALATFLRLIRIAIEATRR